MTPAPSYDAALADRVLELARKGFSRAQIASALGVSLERLAAWAADRQFAEALELAATEERAFWDAQPLEALWATNKTFHPSAWAKAMVQRFGSAAHRTARAEKAAPKPKAPRVIVNIPRNGRERPRDGAGG